MKPFQYFLITIFILIHSSNGFAKGCLMGLIMNSEKKVGTPFINACEVKLVTSIYEKAHKADGSKICFNGQTDLKKPMEVFKINDAKNAFQDNCNFDDCTDIQVYISGHLAFGADGTGKLFGSNSSDSANESEQVQSASAIGAWLGTLSDSVGKKNKGKFNGIYFSSCSSGVSGVYNVVMDDLKKSGASFGAGLGYSIKAPLSDTVCQQGLKSPHGKNFQYFLNNRDAIASADQERLMAMVKEVNGKNLSKHAAVLFNSCGGAVVTNDSDSKFDLLYQPVGKKSNCDLARDNQNLVNAWADFEAMVEGNGNEPVNVEWLYQAVKSSEGCHLTNPKLDHNLVEVNRLYSQMLNARLYDKILDNLWKYHRKDMNDINDRLSSVLAGMPDIPQFKESQMKIKSISPFKVQKTRADIMANLVRVSKAGFDNKSATMCKVDLLARVTINLDPDLAPTHWSDDGKGPSETLANAFSECDKIEN